MDLANALQPAGAPDPAAYKAKSGGIVATMEDMLEKAKAEQADAQKAEMNAKFDFDMLKQKLEDAIAVGNKELGETKTEKAAAEEAKAVAEGELETADKGVADDSKKLQDLQQDCMTKVKGMIQEMIEKLVAEAQKEASHKAFCDKEMSETKAKRDDKQSDLDDLNTKIDAATSKIAKLKEDIATLQSELAAIAKAQKKADAMRAEEAAAWAEAKADYESGVEGVGMALQVLRDYYAQKKADAMR